MGRVAAVFSLILAFTATVSAMDFIESSQLEVFSESMTVRSDIHTSVRVNSPPREYFSMSTLFLQNQYMVHVGHVVLFDPYAENRAADGLLAGHLGWDVFVEHVNLLDG